jgi:Heparinase II/III N-terminus/Heparinase II/III-like protein
MRESSACDTTSGLSVFRKPYCDWTADAILAHYRTRTGVHYFPVLDQEQTARAAIDNILCNRFDLVGESHQLAPNFDWLANPSQDLEWLIMLHKFYYAVGLGAAYHDTNDRRYVEKWVALTSSWIDAVPIEFPSGDAVGRRIQNWIFAHYYFVTVGDGVQLSAAFYVRFLESIYQQVNYLCRHLTPARNHRTIELYSIFLAALVFPELQGADAWLAFATEELSANIQTDLLPDGVHCELSTDYHHVVLKNYLGFRRLAALNDIVFPEAADVLLRRALEFAVYVHKPDGRIPSLSDGDTGSFLDLLADGYDLYQDEALLYVATRGRCGAPPRCRSKGFPEGGYYILRSGWGEGSERFEDERYLVFDCGPLGRGNHGHFDLLSFELAAYGRSLIVDPGRYIYDQSDGAAWRVLFRGTGYHNTVQVDRKNQTRYAFHKTRFKIQGPQPEWELKEQTTGIDFDYLRGLARSHEYDAVHERRIFFFAPEYWIVSDIMRAELIHDYDLLFHLSDAATAKVSVARSERALVVDSPHLVIAQPDDPDVDVSVDEGFVSHTYGVKHPAPVVRCRRRAADAAFHTVLFPFNAARPDIAVEILPVWSGRRRCSPAEAFALAVTVTRDGQQCHDYYLSADPTRVGPYRFGSFTYHGSLLFIREDRPGRSVDIRMPSGAELVDDRSPNCSPRQA